MTKHPTDFYIAHRTVDLGKGPVWANLTDGPCDYAELIDERLPWDEQAPTLENTRIWHFQGDVPCRDVTEDVLDCFYSIYPDVYSSESALDSIKSEAKILLCGVD